MMGNWRTVNIIGTVDKKEVKALRRACLYEFEKDDTIDYHPLCYTKESSLFGLHNWISEKIMARGNLAERNYSVRDVADTLKELVRVAPSLTLKVHCGADWEEEECIATITVKKGRVTIGKPEVEFVKGLSDDEVSGRLYKTITGR